LPLNLAFINQSVDPTNVGARLNTWLIFHWVRVIVSITAGVFAIQGFKLSLKTNNDRIASEQ
jgi:hypothetical protein